jgi:hypothetical protein
LIVYTTETLKASVLSNCDPDHPRESLSSQTCPNLQLIRNRYSLSSIGLLHSSKPGSSTHGAFNVDKERIPPLTDEISQKTTYFKPADFYFLWSKQRDSRRCQSKRVRTITSGGTRDLLTLAQASREGSLHCQNLRRRRNGRREKRLKV